MSFDVYRTDNGYVLEDADGTTWGPGDRESTAVQLQNRRVHARDIVELLSSADAHYQSGTTEEVRSLRMLKRRIKNGLASDAELEDVRRELSDPMSSADKTSLIGVLAVAGWSEATEACLTALLQQSRDTRVAKFALEALSRWPNATGYEKAALPFITGVAWDVDREVQRRAIAQAGWAMKERRAAELLGPIVDIAEKDLVVGYVARLAVLNASGGDSIAASLRDPIAGEIEEWAGRARARLDLQGPS